MLPENEWFEVDVITCAAPYLAKRKHTNGVALFELFKSRIKNIFEAARDNNVDYLILGAFGCGVFGQDPERVATHFCDLLTYDFANCFKHVEFAIPVRANPENYEAFKKVLTRYGLILDFSKK